jgi:predicted phage-related endonuclease
MTHNMNEIIRQLKEYDAMEKELKKEVEALRQEAIAFMTEEGVDEYMTDEGKVTYREVISKRFASTEFKKIHADLYNAFCKQTANMRFTLS